MPLHRVHARAWRRHCHRHTQRHRCCDETTSTVAAWRCCTLRSGVRGRDRGSRAAGSDGVNRQAVQYATKRELLDLLSVRATAADRYDTDLMRACHPADGTDNHGTYRGLMHGFIAGLERAQKLGPPCISKEHVLGNALFDFRGDDVFVESYHVAHERFVESGRGVDYRIGGRYLDTFRLSGGRWLIQHRDIVYDWSR